MKLKDICKQHTIVGDDGVNYCDTENCPFAKQDLGIDFSLTDHYSCIADYPYLKEKHESDLLKEFVKRISYSLINDDRVEYDEYLKIMAIIRQDLENFLNEKENNE